MKIKKYIYFFLLLGVVTFYISSCNPNNTKIEKLSIKEQKVSFGKMLFFDKNLSINNQISCASCHLPDNYFTNNLKKGIGVFGRESMRNVPSLINVKFSPYFQYDGGVKTLEMQLLVPIQDTNEMGEQMGHILKKRLNKKYESLAMKLYGRKFDAYVLTRAIGAYERSIVNTTTKYSLSKKNKIKLSYSVEQGGKLFRELNCNHCHSGKLFTNYAFYDNGIVEHSTLDLGRYRITNKNEDKWRFKVPSLINCEQTYPYMHDGSKRSLLDVIRSYETSSKRLTKIRNLSNKEEQFLLDFLKSLSNPLENQ